MKGTAGAVWDFIGGFLFALLAGAAVVGIYVAWPFRNRP